MRRFQALILLLLPVAAAAQSCTTAVCKATGTSEAAVLAALPSSSNTNATVVVNIPSGTSAWTTGLTYTVPAAVTNLTIQGATATTWSGTPGTSGYSYSVNDNTVIQDTYQSNNPLMTFNLGASNTHFRVTGLTMEGGSIGGSSGSYSKYNGLIEAYTGNSQNVRIDHNHFNVNTYSPSQTSVFFRSFAPIAGVGDHNVLDEGNNTEYNFGFSIFGAYNDTIGNGDGTFQNRTAWGSPTSFYVESNYMTGGVIDDCGGGGAIVIRYNYMTSASVAVQTHGTKTQAGPDRGCRMIEVYDNYITSTESTASAAVGTKIGPGMFFNNTMAAGYYRFFEGGGDRESGDAAETSTPSGWGYCGTSANGNGVGSPWDGNQNTGTGYPCFDGVGRGQTAQALNGANFPNRLNSVTGTKSWPHQYLEPLYLWNNSIGSASYMLFTDNSVNNQDYYYDCGSANSSCTGSFTGTAGTGHGPLASRPSTCKAGQGGTYFTSPTGSYGVAYFATDANSGNGELYVCTATNTWTPIYQPYTYPHPLVAGSTSGTGPTGPGQPMNLAGTVH